MLPAPAATWIFPTLFLRIFPQMLHPLPRLSLEVHLPVSSFESSAFPVLAMGRLPASFHVYDFTWCEISRLQIFLHVEASEFARLPGRSYRCILAGQPRLLRPGRTCFVTSACTGYANRPNQVIDGARTFTLLDSQPCRLLIPPLCYPSYGASDFCPGRYVSY